MQINWPTILTWARIILIPVVVTVFYLPIPIQDANLIATIAFATAAITDWFDGWLARRLRQTSAFGAFLDPVADKLMVAAALLVLVQLNRADAALAIVIVGREITISALREWMATIGAGKSVAVSFVGKLKTSAQLVAIPMLLYNEPIGQLPIQQIGIILLWGATALTLWSMIYYMKRAQAEIQKLQI